MMLYLNNCKESTKKLLEMKPLWEYKINTQKSVAFQHKWQTGQEKNPRVGIPFTEASKLIKYVATRQTKKIKDLCSKNF